MHVILAVLRLKHEDHYKFEVSLNYRASSKSVLAAELSQAHTRKEK